MHLSVACVPRVCAWQLTGKLWPIVAEVDVAPAPELEGSLALCQKHQMTVQDTALAQKLVSGHMRV